MATTPSTSTTSTGPNHAAIDTGPPAEWRQGGVALPDGTPLPGKHFLRDRLALTGAEISVNGMPPGAAVPFLHRHRENEEIYLFLEGRGQFQVDQRQFDVGPGAVVRVDPAGARSWRNTGKEELVYVVIQAKAGTSVGSAGADGERVEGEPIWD